MRKTFLKDICRKLTGMLKLKTKDNSIVLCQVNNNKPGPECQNTETVLKTTTKAQLFHH